MGIPMIRLLNERLVRWLFWPTLLFAFVMAALPKPPHTPIDRFGDKFAHALAFFVITILAQWGYGKGRRWWIALALSAFGAAIELVQAIPALHRDSELADWEVDTAVVLVVTLAFLLFDRLQSRLVPLGPGGDDHA